MSRVVITGMGVITANAHGLENFEAALREGKSGIRFHDNLKELNFGCQVGGIPEGTDTLKKEYFSDERLLAMNSNMTYAGIAAIDCWRDSKLPEPDPNSDIDWDTGAIVGTGIGGLDTIAEKVVPNTNNGKVRRIGSTAVEQIMGSSISALIGGLLGLGGKVSSNSSACSTGTEAIIDAYHAIKEGRTKRMLAGGSEGGGKYAWAPFDSMRVLNRNHNDQPEKASRPMSATAGGFIPSSGAGVLLLESLESALERNARIYCEIIGAHINCGGQRAGGSITAPNPDGVVRCIKKAMMSANIEPKQIDVINGHLTATMADPIEIMNWAKATGLSPEEFPYVNSTKSLIGHALGAAGGIECVGAVLQLYHGFIHGSLNCEDIHDKLLEYRKKIPQKTINVAFDIIAKASFGFGDVNACLLFKKWGS